MLHIHFGAGRLGLGLVAPFFQSPSSQTHLLNRASGGSKATGQTALASHRRNELLAGHPDRSYVIAPPGNSSQDGRSQRERVRYDGFSTYDDTSIAAVIDTLLETTQEAHQDGVIVTGSVLTPDNYRPILRTLDILARQRARGAVGPVFLVACENTLIAHEVLDHPALPVTDAVRHHVTPVSALVDRICVGMEEDRSEAVPSVLVRAEPYGSLKLQLCPELEPLVAMLEGSRIEFSRHLATEKQVKSWLLNGSHWLIALSAFSETQGDRDMKLNEFLRGEPHRVEFATTILQEMQHGVATILRSDPHYADFIRDVDADDYLDGVSRSVLTRFMDTEDSITRILARFQAPSPEAHATVEAFSKRFADRVGEPLTAYQQDRGIPPQAATQSILGLVKLLASGTFIDTQGSSSG